MSVESEVVAALGLARKEHGVVTICLDHSNGKVNGMVVHHEDASSPEELTYKYQTISDAVIEALNGDNIEGGAVREMGDDFLMAMEASGGDLVKAQALASWKEVKQMQADRKKGKKTAAPKARKK